jgi:negative regulator of sigma E activity
MHRRAAAMWEATPAWCPGSGAMVHSLPALSVLALAILFVACLPAASATQAAKRTAAPAPLDTSPIDLYRKSLDAAAAFSYGGRQFIMSFGDEGRSSSYVTQLTHIAPDRYLIVYRAPHNFLGQTIIQTKSDQWTYMPEAKLLVHTAVPKQTTTREDKLAVLLRNYKITRLPDPKIVAGRETFEVIVQRRGNPKASARYWIDPYTGLTLRTERYHVDGSVALVSYFSDIAYHPSVPANAFNATRFEKPGVRVVQKDAAKESSDLSAAQIDRAIGGSALDPAKIGDFELQGASTVVVHKRETLHLRYNDGLSSLSLFESARVSKHPTVVPRSRRVNLGKLGIGWARRDMHYNALNWDQGRINLTLVGDLPVSQLAQLAQTL